VGFQVCLLTAVYSFCKQACLWQLTHGRTPAEANREVADVLICASPAIRRFRVISQDDADAGSDSRRAA
jgi:hypothetical protein